MEKRSEGKTVSAVRREAERLTQGASLRTLAIFYWARFQAKPLRELLAIAGIAAGVALLFSVQVDNQSRTGSNEQLADSIAGRATLEVAARSAGGFDQDLFRRVMRLPSVEGAAPILERRVAVVGPRGRKPLTLFGVDDRLTEIGGRLVHHVAQVRMEAAGMGLHLPAPIAEAIGTGVGDTVVLEAGGWTSRTPVAGVYSAEEVGSVAETPAAVAPLGLVQDITRVRGRISRLLVAPVRGREGAARTGLKRLSSGRLDVRSSDTESEFLAGVLKAQKQATTLASIVGLLVGALLAYNAMLLTILERRAIVSTLRMLGSSRRSILSSLLFDAIVVGLAGSLVGLVLGDQFSRHLLGDVEDNFASAFIIGGQRIITPSTVGLSVIGGVIAAVAGSAQPAIELMKVGPREALSRDEPGAFKASGGGLRRWAFWAGVTLIVLATALSASIPRASLIAVNGLVVGIAMTLPTLVAQMLALAQRLVRRLGGAVAHLSVSELVATPSRATALAATGTFAVFAILSILGPVHDVQRGIDRLAVDTYPNADLWVSPGRSENTYRTVPFNHARVARRIRSDPAIGSVRVFRSSFLDLKDRRILLIGESPKAPSMIAPSQLVEGDLSLANRRLRRGGWAALTEFLARRRGIDLGESFTLPTPRGSRRFRLAATISSYAWIAGSVLINNGDYGRYWGKADAAALEVSIASGATPSQGRRAVERALGRGSPLRVQSPAERRTEIATTARKSLIEFEQLADLVLAAAVLAVIAAMLAAVLQRRRSLMALRAFGMGGRQLYRALFLETGAILGIGCSIGVGFGLLGQVIAGRWISVTMGHPVVFSPAFGLAFQSVALAILIAVVATALPARLSLRFSPQATFSPE